MGNWWLTASSRQHTRSCITSCAEVFVKQQITQETQPRYSPDLIPCDFWLFPKLKSPLTGKRVQTISEIQENMKGQLMEIGRTGWGPKAPTLKGTETSFSCVQWSLYLVSSSIYVSISHIILLDTFCTDLFSVYCPDGPDSGFEYSTQSYIGYKPTSMLAICARYNPYLQTRHGIEQLKQLGHRVDKVDLLWWVECLWPFQKNRDYFTWNLHDTSSGHTSNNIYEAVKCSERGITIAWEELLL